VVGAPRQGLDIFAQTFGFRPKRRTGIAGSGRLIRLSCIGPQRFEFGMQIRRHSLIELAAQLPEFRRDGLAGHYVLFLQPGEFDLVGMAPGWRIDRVEGRSAVFSVPSTPVVITLMATRG